jgi:hypothetical protein
MLSDRAWGGGLELVAFSHSRRVNVHVYRVIVTSICIFSSLLSLFDSFVPIPRCVTKATDSEECDVSTLKVPSSPSALHHGTVITTISLFCVLGI